MALSPEEQSRIERERANAQKIINEGLESSEKLTRNISQELQSQLNISKKINKQIMDRADVINRMVQNEKSGSSLADKIKNTQSDIAEKTLAIAKTKKKNGELDRRFSQNTIDNLNENKQILETRLKELEANQKSRDAVKDTTKALTAQIQKVADSIRGLPGGNLLLKGLGMTPENIEQFGKNLTKVATKELPAKFSSLLQGMTGVVSSLAVKLGIVAITAFAIFKTFKFFLNTLKDASKIIDSIGAQFGVMGAQDLGMSFVKARPDTIRLGRDIQDLVNITDSLSSNFGVSVDEAFGLSEQILDSSVAMGLTADEGSKLFGTLMLMGGLTAQQAEDLAEGAFQLARANQINPSAVMRDVASSTETFAKFAKDGGENIFMAAIQARKLGVNLDTVAGIAESLLDFQSSLEKELSLQVLLGRQVNMNKARELALSNNLTGMMDEVLRQLGGEAEFNRLNFFQRKAMADLLGVEVGTMQKLVRGQSDLSHESKTFADLMGKDALANLTSILNEFKALGAEILTNLIPVLDTVAQNFRTFLDDGGMETLKNVVTVISNAMIGIVENFKTISTIAGGLAGFAVGGIPGGILGALSGFGVTNMLGFANGGSFMTSGPTPIMVGDNPGGKEFVQVIPFNGGSNNMTPNVEVVNDTKPLADEVNSIKSEISQLRLEMKSYFGVGGSAIRGIGSRVGTEIKSL